MKNKLYIFIGRSGCGKGTQADLLIKHIKEREPNREVLYVQSGGEFREFIEGESDTQKLSKDIYDVGGLQPEFLSIYMWVNVLIKKYKKNSDIVVDGSPRKFHEAGVLDSIIEFYKLDEAIVINVDISEEEAIRRLMSRNRFDDNMEDIYPRMSWYEADVAPTIEFYRNNNQYKFIKVDGQRPIDDVHKDIISKL